MPKIIHKYKYRILSRGTKPYPLINIKFWKWGFGVSYNTQKWIGGFAINSRPKDTKTDKYTQKKR